MGGFFKEKYVMKKDILKKDYSIGSWITLGNEDIAEIFVNAGYDWIVIDLEHSMISINQVGKLIRIIDLAGVVPLVRLTSNCPNQIKRVMDAGAKGIIVPNVNTVEDARMAVSSTRYAPKGIRGVGLARAQKYGNNFKQYFKWQKTEPIVIVQIEDKKALDNLNGIFSQEGVDGFIIGPYDLSCSMGMAGDFENPIFKKTIRLIRKTGYKSGCLSGIHIIEPDYNQLKKSIKDGFNLIVFSVDIRMLDVAARIPSKHL